MIIDLTFEDTFRYAKWKTNFKVISDKYRLVGKSEKDFDEAQERLLELIELKIWSESFNLKFNVKVK